MIRNIKEEKTLSNRSNTAINKLIIAAYVYILGNKVRINFLAFFSSRLMKVFGATIAEKKIKLPIRKGIKKVTRLFKISVILTSIFNCI